MKPTNDQPATDQQSQPDQQAQPEQQQQNPLEVTLEGDVVPEKFKGKKVQDILQVARDLEAAKTQLEQEVQQWRIWAATKLQEIEQRTQQQHQHLPTTMNVPEGVEPEVAQTVQQLVQKQVTPIIEGVSRMMKEYVKSVRPDFDQYEQKATQYYNALPPEAKVHPEYGWDFAYRLAKAEAMGVAKPQVQQPAPGPTTQAPSAPPRPPLSDAEKKVAQIYGLSEDEWHKFSNLIDPTTFKGGK